MMGYPRCAYFLFVVGSCFFAHLGAAQAEAVIEAFENGTYRRAVGLASALLDESGDNVQILEYRAASYDRLGEYEDAISDYDRLLSQPHSRTAELRQRRGSLRFRAGLVKESIADFDAFLKAFPDRIPHHWQRGISYYYAKRYADGIKQFEVHRAVNGRDVENALWHYMCVARLRGIDVARKQFIPVVGDPRVPMMALHRLFGGTGSIADVEAGTAKDGRPRARFYADLYLGIYCELHEKPKLAAKYLAAAAKADRAANGYMGDVARVHHALTVKAESQKKP